MKGLQLLKRAIAVIGFSFAVIGYADTYFFRNGKGLAGISQADRQLTVWTYFVTEKTNENYLHEDVMLAMLEVYDRDVRPKLDNLKYEIVFYKIANGKTVATMDLYYNDDIGFSLATFSLYDEKVIDEIEITRDEYEDICKKVNGSEKFDIVKLFKEMKKSK